MDFTPILTAMMGLDYNSSSIGIDFGTTASGVKKIQIIPDGKFTVHRVTQRTLDLYTSADNSTYTIIPRTSWTFATDSKGVITITLNERVATRYLKVHVKFDERDSYFNAKSKATFLNDFAKMLRIYQEATSRTEEFRYDAAGNRTYQQVTLIQSNSFTSSYYTNSDRLKTDGKYAFAYDEAGNVVKKGNKFTISGDTVSFTTIGEGVEYWQYQFNLLNQLISVTKNGTIVSEYAYNPEGLRVVKKAKGETTHYVFEGTEPIFEKRITDSKIKSYIYALGKHLARVDGIIGDTNAKVYYYHTDQVGSVRVITDQAGKVVFNADYFAFGAKFVSNGDFDETHGFTGKEYDSDTGLYYYNARWYDSELGRFISEDDPAADPNNPNLYSYCGNNSLNRIDPSGQCACLIALAWSALLAGIAKTAAGINTWEKGGTFWSGYCGEPITIGASTNGTQARPYLGKEYGFADIDIGNTGDINYGGVSYSGYSDRYLRDDYNIKEQDYLEPYHLPEPEDFGPPTVSSDTLPSKNNTSSKQANVKSSAPKGKYENTTIGADHTPWYTNVGNAILGPVGDVYVVLTNGDRNPITGQVYREGGASRSVIGNIAIGVITWGIGKALFSGVTSLYRAVGPNEFYNIMETGKFSIIPEGLQAKQFGLNLGETLKFANKYKDIGAIIEVKVPTGILNKIGDFTQVDKFIFKHGTVTIHVDKLGEFNNIIQKIIHKF